MKSVLPALALASLLGACGTDSASLVGVPCSTDASPLALDAQSSLGFSPAQALDLAVQRFETVHVEWVHAVAAPTEETFSFAFGTPLGAEERQAEADCGARTWVSVEVPVQISSASGHLAASDTVELWALRDTDDSLQVFVQWPEEEQRMDSTVSGPYADAAHAEHDGLYLMHLSLSADGFFSADDPVGQGIGVGAEYENAQAGISSSLYRCGPEEDTSASCLTWAAP